MCEYIGGMRQVKNIRITDESHKWLTMQRALTGVPANQQVQNMIEREKQNAQKNDLPRNVQTSKMAKETT